MVSKRLEQRLVSLLLQLSQRSNDLIHLIAFGMTALSLQVERIPRPKCSEDVVAPADAWFTKKVCTDRHYLTKPYVGPGAFERPQHLF
jgi:hypothetical protein